MQVDGRNYLVPVDAKIETASDLNFETVDLDKILASLHSGTRATIIILDACRAQSIVAKFLPRGRAPRPSGRVSRPIRRSVPER